MRKIIFIFLLSITMFICKPSKAQTYEVVKLENGIGKQKLNYEHLAINEENGCTKLEGYYKIPANTVYAIYASYNFVGSIKDTTEISYKIYNELEDDFKAHTTNWIIGGWYASAYIENNSSQSCYFSIESFGNNGSNNKLVKDKNIIMQQVESKEGSNYKGYYDFVGENSGYVKYDDTETYTLVLKEGTSMEMEDFISLLYSTWYDGYMDPQVSTNYKPEVGEYKFSYSYDDERDIDLNIVVVPEIEPQIVGPELVRVNLSEWGSFSKEKLIAKYSGDYGSQACTIQMTAQGEENYDNLAGMPGNCDIELKGTFTGGKIAYKTIKLQIVNDTRGELFIKSFILTTDTYSNMTEDELIDYIDAQLALNDYYIPNSVEIIKNNYIGNENKPGRYEIVFKYRQDGEEIYSTLEVTVEESIPPAKIDYTKFIIPSISVMAIFGMTVYIIILKRKTRRS